MPLWAKIYWVVAIALFGVWVWRRIRGRTASSPTPPDSSPFTGSTAASTTSRSGPDSGSDLGPGSDPTQRVWPAPPPLDPHDDTYRLEPSDAAGAGAGSDSSHLAEDDHTGSADASTQPAPPAQPGPPGATLPELLAGITLPHELVPLTQVGVSVDLATHVVVATRKAPYEVVVEGLSVELERLGYDVDRSSMTELRASGERGIVKVVVHPDGAKVTDGGLPRFPTAEEQTVVVELFAG